MDEKEMKAEEEKQKEEIAKRMRAMEKELAELKNRPTAMQAIFEDPERFETYKDIFLAARKNEISAQSKDNTRDPFDWVKVRVEMRSMMDKITRDLRRAKSTLDYIYCLAQLRMLKWAYELTEKP